MIQRQKTLVNRVKKKQISNSLLFKSDAEDCTSRGAKDRSPTKSYKNTDHHNYYVQSIHMKIKRDWDWTAYNETSRDKRSTKLC